MISTFEQTQSLLPAYIPNLLLLLRLGEVEAVQVHYLIPCSYEVM